MMKNAKKHSRLIISMSLLSFGAAFADSPSLTPQAQCLMAPAAQSCELDQLNIYVGPQSVEPGETLYIAVETETRRGGSAAADSVVIVNAQTGEEYTAVVKDGLASLEIQAPTQAGRITFSAMNNAIASRAAEVLVHAAKPDDFDLRLEKDKNQIFVNSSLLSDAFGNLVEDGQSARVEIRFGDKLILVTQAQTENARLSFRIDCNALFEANANMSVILRGAKATVLIPAYLCGRSDK